VYDLNAHWKEEALAAVTELRANGVLAGSADMYRVSVALLVDGTGDAEGVVSQNLRVYRSFRGHFAEATDELIAACGLERGAVPASTALQMRNSVWAKSPAAAKPTMTKPRTPERNTSREASQARATA
jgi:hypothetical protein